MSLDLSIIVCSYNNYNSLLRTLSDIENCYLHDSKVELILVNNNSSDNTKNLADWSPRSKNISYKYILVEAQGLSYARNAGVQKSRSRYLLFTDDDASIPPNWISEYLLAISKFSPDCLFSKIHVNWGGHGKPWWYLDEYRPFFVDLDYGESIILVKDFDHEFFGKNFCVKKDIIESLGGFDTTLGRVGGKLIAGEETLLYWKMIDRGLDVMYFPSAPVMHNLKSKEYKINNIKRAIIDSAYTQYRLSKYRANRSFCGRPLYPLMKAIYLLIRLPLKMFVTLFRGDRNKFIYYKTYFIKSLVMIKLWLSDDISS